MTAKPPHAALRLALLVSWQERGRWYFLNRLRQAGCEVTVLCPYFSGAPRPLARASVWLSRFYLPLRAVLRPGEFDAVASWNLPYATALGLLRRVLGRFMSLPPHLARDFHIDPSRAEDPGYALKLRLIGAALPGIDLALTTSRAEEAAYAARFRQPADRFRFFPDAPPSELFNVAPRPVAEHVFAYGNSDRDFDTLLAAAALIDAPVTLLSQTYVPRAPLPANVTLLRAYVSREELVRLIATARCCVVPLRDFRVAAGQNSMFEVMALGRPLVIADNIAVAEYVSPGRDALLYPPGDAAALAERIRFFLDDPAGAEGFGQRARLSSQAWLSRQVELFLQILRSPRIPAINRQEH